MNAFGIEVDKGAVRIFGSGVSKHEALESLIDAVVASDAIIDPRRFREAVHERENVMSTGIGSGVAIPHVRIDEVRRPCVGHFHRLFEGFEG